MSVLSRFFHALRIALPFLIKAVVYSWADSISCLWVGIPEATRNIANDWCNTVMMQTRFPTPSRDKLWYTFRAIAVAVIVVEWVISSFTVVWLVVLLF